MCVTRNSMGKIVRDAWLTILAVLLCGTLAASAEMLIRSGYALVPAQCGNGELTFPRIKIDMKAGFCAGLVASRDDRLKFPRAIVQIPGRPQLVIADMGGWGHADGRLLLLDPSAAQGG